MVSGWHEEPIAKAHDRKAFDCGDADLNNFLQRYARQSHESGSAKTFLAISNSDHAKVLGFYSVAPAALDYDRLLGEIQRGLPRHSVPGYLLARIATHVGLQGQGLGGQLLLAAGRRCLRVAAEAGGIILIINAKNDRATAWYVGYGAVPLQDAERTLVMPLKMIEAVLRDAGKL
jgi:GNAT superfamily N-acetyltransferase